MSFAERLAAVSRTNQSAVCVGLDLDLARLPAPLRDQPDGALRFAEAIVVATADLVCAYKPNLGFYLPYGTAGLTLLADVVALIRARAPMVPVILDAKFGDIDITATGYARFTFDWLKVDAVTLSPYLGEDSLRVFLERTDRAAFILCKTSNPGSGDLQDLPVGDRPLYQVVASRIAAWQARYGTCGAVVGATYPEHLAQVRALLPAVPILIPGVGAQGGALAATVQAGRDSAGGGIVINASRSVLYASADDDFAARARGAADELRVAINSVGGQGADRAFS